MERAETGDDDGDDGVRETEERKEESAVAEVNHGLKGLRVFDYAQA